MSLSDSLAALETSFFRLSLESEPPPGGFLGGRAFASGTITSARISRSESTKLSSERSSSDRASKRRSLSSSSLSESKMMSVRSALERTVIDSVPSSVATSTSYECHHSQWAARSEERSI
jgi:hypothetical protein